MIFTRRRFIAISAAAAGFPLMPFLHQGAAASEARTLRSWHGVALGADAMLQINHPDPVVADRLIADSLAEVRRLERIFNLYREDSEICRLNSPC